MKNNNLIEEYNFDNLVVSANNRLAQASAVVVAEGPGDYNPLVIYGGPGLGKTYFMHCIGNYIIEQDPNANVLYVTSTEFAKEVKEIVENDDDSAENLMRLREKYENLDVLLLDDIQLLLGKCKACNELSRILSTLCEKKKQIVITLDRPPKNIAPFLKDFFPQLTHGLIADIQYPDFETRKAILKKVAESYNYDFDDEVLNYIVNHVKSNYMELKESFKIALSILEKNSMDINLSKEGLKELSSPFFSAEISPEKIMDVVCDHFNVTFEDIRSSNRDEKYAYPRKIIMYLCRTLTDRSIKEIAQFLGDRDNATIIYGERIISDLIEKDENTEKTIETIIEKLKS